MNRYTITIVNKDINRQYDRQFIIETYQPLWAVIQDISKKHYGGQYILYSIDCIEHDIYTIKN